MNLTNHHLGVILVVDNVKSENFLNTGTKVNFKLTNHMHLTYFNITQVNKRENFGEHYIWLMISYGPHYDLKRELKYNWTIGLDTDLTIASINPNMFEYHYNMVSLYRLFDGQKQILFTNLERTEGWDTRIVKFEPSPFDLFKFLKGNDTNEIFADIIKMRENYSYDEPLDLVILDDRNQEINALAYYKKLSSIDSNITLDMVKTSFGFWPRDIFFCKLWEIDRSYGGVIYFHIDQFYKIDSSTDAHECFVNQLGTLHSSGMSIGNHAIEVEERNNLGGRTLNVARIETNTTEDSSIYTIFMNFLAASLNAR